MSSTVTLMSPHPGACYENDTILFCTLEMFILVVLQKNHLQDEPAVTNTD